MIARILILGILIFLILVVARKINNILIKKFNSNNSNHLEEDHSVLVKCSKCGAMVPKEYVDSKGEKIFYCKDHSDEQ